MNVRLEAAEGDPWRLHPQLATIWPEPYNSEAAFASKEDSHTGQVFLIKYGEDVVGASGFFFQPDDFLCAYLRWHGVIPELRRRGIAKVAVKMTALVVSTLHPDRRFLVELAPDNEYGKTVEPFFQNAGFVKHPERTNYCGDWWWPWLFDLRDHT